MLSPKDTPSVPSVVGIALASSFAMLKALSRHPGKDQQCGQALTVLSDILSNLSPLSLRGQKQQDDLERLQAFLGNMRNEQGPVTEAQLALAVTRGTMRSALSAVSALYKVKACPSQPSCSPHSHPVSFSQQSDSTATLPAIFSEVLRLGASDRLSPPLSDLLAETVPLQGWKDDHASDAGPVCVAACAGGLVAYSRRGLQRFDKHGRLCTSASPQFKATVWYFVRPMLLK